MAVVCQQWCSLQTLQKSTSSHFVLETVLRLSHKSGVQEIVEKPLQNCWKIFSILKHLCSSEAHNKRWDVGNQSLYFAIWARVISDRSHCRCRFSPGCWETCCKWETGNLTLMDSGCYKVRAEAFNMHSLDSLQHTRSEIVFCRLFWQEQQKNLQIFCLQLLASINFSSVRWGKPPSWQLLYWIFCVLESFNLQQFHHGCSYLREESNPTAY